MGGSLVVLSGGQDSTTCLFWAKQNIKGPIHAVTFDYDQRHQIEIQSAIKVAEIAKVDSHDIVTLGPVLRGSSPLVNKERSVGTYDSVEVLPGGVEPTFIPGRNALFLVLAANRMAHLKVDSIVIGVCQEDFGGYFDCRQEFIWSMQECLSEGLLGSPTGVQIHTPLMNLKKKEVVDLAYSLPGCFEAMAHTHTCYQGMCPPCLKCHACLLRARGFKESGHNDPLVASCKRDGKLGPEVPDHGLLVG